MKETTNICIKCGRKHGNKEPGFATAYPGKCAYCGKIGIGFAKRDFGIYDDVKELDNLFNIDLFNIK